MVKLTFAMTMIGLLSMGNTISSQVTKNGSVPTVAAKLREHHIALTQTALVQALRNSDTEVRYLAAEQLAVDRAVETVPAMVDALERETVPGTKVNIAFAVARLGDERGVSELKNTCKDVASPAYLRVRATSYLIEVNKESCLRPILKMAESTSDSDPTARIEALSLLARFKNVSKQDSAKIHELVLNALSDPAPTMRMTASNTLNMLEDTSSIPYLERAIASEQEEAVRSQMQADLQQLLEKRQR